VFSVIADTDHEWIFDATSCPDLPQHTAADVVTVRAEREALHAAERAEAEAEEEAERKLTASLAAATAARIKKAADARAEKAAKIRERIKKIGETEAVPATPAVMKPSYPPRPPILRPPIPTHARPWPPVEPPLPVPVEAAPAPKVCAPVAADETTEIVTPQTAQTPGADAPPSVGREAAPSGQTTAVAEPLAAAKEATGRPSSEKEEFAISRDGETAVACQPAASPLHAKADRRAEVDDMQPQEAAPRRCGGGSRKLLPHGAMPAIMRAISTLARDTSVPEADQRLAGLYAAMIRGGSFGQKDAVRIRPLVSRHRGKLDPTVVEIALREIHELPAVSGAERNRAWRQRRGISAPALPRHVAARLEAARGFLGVDKPWQAVERALAALERELTAGKP